MWFISWFELVLILCNSIMTNKNCESLLLVCLMLCSIGLLLSYRGKINAIFLKKNSVLLFVLTYKLAHKSDLLKTVVFWPFRIQQNPNTVALSCSVRYRRNGLLKHPEVQLAAMTPSLRQLPSTSASISLQGNWSWSEGILLYFLFILLLEVGGIQSKQVEPCMAVSKLSVRRQDCSP